jgi:phosphoribosylglycinamide formyltransferase-1
MKNIVILISGTGSNMKAIVQYAQSHNWLERFNAKVALVLSSSPSAKGLEWAQEQGLQTIALDHRAYRDSPEPRAAFEKELIQSIDPYQPHLVVLAGFMRILSPSTTRHFEGRMMNIHPSILPAFTGLNTHQRALDAGCRVAGATVHWVSEDLDAGKIIAQAVVPVLEGDDANTLGQRVLCAEHQLYPRAIEDHLKR